MSIDIDRRESACDGYIAVFSHVLPAAYFFFFKINYFKNIFHEHDQSVKRFGPVVAQGVYRLVLLQTHFFLNLFLFSLLTCSQQYHRTNSTCM